MRVASWHDRIKRFAPVEFKQKIEIWAVGPPAFHITGKQLKTWMESFRLKTAPRFCSIGLGWTLASMTLTKTRGGQWHNVQRHYRFNMLFCDGHAEFFDFPQEAYKWNCPEPKLNPNFKWC
jgi:prepilin-type processing-associated H-X9-DG protein